MAMTGQAVDAGDPEKGNYTLIRGPEDFQTGLYDKPLPCYGCGIGWFSWVTDLLSSQISSSCLTIFCV